MLLDHTSSDPIVVTIAGTLPETDTFDDDLEKDLASARENIAVLSPSGDNGDGTDMAGSSCGLGPNDGSDVDMNGQTEEFEGEMVKMR